MAVVYLHLTEDENIPFYVGIGKQISRAHYFHSRSDFWNRIKNKYGIKVQILYTNLRWDQAVEKEKQLILFYGRRDLGTGTLCNLTDGGEGVVGNKMTKSQKKYLSKLNTGKKASKEKLKKMYKPVVQMDLEGNFIAEFESMKHAYAKTGVNFRGISETCLGRLKTSGGFTWKYKV